MKKNFLIIGSLVVFALLVCAFFVFKFYSENTVVVRLLTQIDNYQSRYFEIIKRNNFLIEFDVDTKKDKKDLEKLYLEVEKRIDANNEYLKKYYQNENDFKNSPIELETTAQMNKYAYEGYKKVDELLNEVYQEVRKKISSEEFEELKISQRNWLQEVEDYGEVFDAQGFGTIGTVIYYDYQMDMRKFRTLLLMLYL